MFIMDNKVSVIVPVYQVRVYLERCVNSILRQTFQNIEIILIDDGSTDGGGELCDEYAKQDTRVKVIHKTNGGLSSARNAGLEVAKGKYIAFVDSDDWVSPNFIRSMYEVCEGYECDICQCGFYEVIKDDLDMTDREGIPLIYRPLEYSYAEFSLLSWECVVSWNKLYKRTLFRDICFPAGRLHEDEFTTYKLINKANRIAVLPTRLYYYRRRGDSIVGRKYSYKRLDAGIAYREREKFYRENHYVELEQLTKARHLQWLKGQIKQFETLESRNESIERAIVQEENQIKEELGSVSVLRKDFLRNQYIFPFDMVEKKSNIVLYGGGMVGQQYFMQIRATNYCNVMLWADRNYVKLRRIGIPVDDPVRMSEVSDKIDYFVIAIVKREIASSVIEMLENELSVDRGKIIYCLNSVMDVGPYNNRII